MIFFVQQIVSHYGLEAENQLLRSLLTEAAKTSWDTDRTGPAVNSIHASLLAQYLGSLLSHPAKSTVVCRAVDTPNRSVQKVRFMFILLVCACICLKNGCSPTCSGYGVFILTPNSLKQFEEFGMSSEVFRITSTYSFF